MLVLAILVYFWEESVQEREWLFDERPAYRLFLAGVVAALLLTDGLIELAARRRKSDAV